MSCLAHVSVFIMRVNGYLERFSFIFSNHTGRREKATLLSDRTDPPIRSPSASAALPSAGGRGRAGCLPKRGVRVGVNG